MTLPTVLDSPREITQSPRTCWAAAFESWTDATATLNGAHNSHTMNQLIYDFDRWHMTRNDRLTNHGTRLLASLGLMKVQEYSPRRLTVQRIGTLLVEHGYLYLLVFGESANGGRAGHAVVCYGATSEKIHVMDPLPGRGLWELPAANFLQSGDVRLFVGTSLVTTLNRDVTAAVNRLQGAAFR